MPNNFQQLWHRVCESCAIPRPIAEQWLANIQNRYNGEALRLFHNFDLLELKSDFILTNQSDVAVSDAVVLSVAFQYYHFDVKCDCSVDNLNALNEFAEATGILHDHVSGAYCISCLACWFLCNLDVWSRCSKCYCNRFGNCWATQTQMVQQVMRTLASFRTWIWL